MLRSRWGIVWGCLLAASCADGTPMGPMPAESAARQASSVPTVVAASGTSEIVDFLTFVSFQVDPPIQAYMETNATGVLTNTLNIDINGESLQPVVDAKGTVIPTKYNSTQVKLALNCTDARPTVEVYTTHAAHFFPSGSDFAVSGDADVCTGDTSGGGGSGGNGGGDPCHYEFMRIFLNNVEIWSGNVWLCEE